MLLPNQSPVVLIAAVIALLALALAVIACDRLRQPVRRAPACPRCGQAFDPQTGSRHNQRTMYHGRYTVTPLHTCPACGEIVPMADAIDRP